MDLDFAQRQSLNKIISLVLKNSEPGVAMFYIDYEPVACKKFLDALRAEGAHKLPFAYSRKNGAFYLLTREYLKENNKRV